MLNKIRLAYKLAKRLSSKELQQALDMPQEDLPVEGDGQGVVLPYMTEEEAFEYIKDTQGGWGKLKDKLRQTIKGNDDNAGTSV